MNANVAPRLLVTLLLSYIYHLYEVIIGKCIFNSSCCPHVAKNISSNSFKEKINGSNLSVSQDSCCGVTANYVSYKLICFPNWVFWQINRASTISPVNNLQACLVFWSDESTIGETLVSLPVFTMDFSPFDYRTSIQNGLSRKILLFFDSQALTSKLDIYCWCFRSINAAMRLHFNCWKYPKVEQCLYFAHYTQK